MQRRWDIFCTVVDNFGDIGVCWRLAKQLTQDHNQKVRLWVDDLLCFSCIAPEVNAEIQQQNVQSIEVCHWQTVFPNAEPADVVIEAFACELPDVYIAAMVRKNKRPVWINLEYLSAEPWVAQYHGLPSPHPRFPLSKTFFFPGFVKGTGGLLREKNLLTQREVFDGVAKRLFLDQKGLCECRADEIRIALFCYDSAPIENLIGLLSESLNPVLLIVPQGRVADRIVAILSYAALPHDSIIKHKQLTVQIVPFMAQNDYDRLLWSCDVNFVRGEDSFVRAQWAGNPFIWNIYPQAEGVHWKKLDAFLDLYTVDMPPGMAIAVREMWFCWNDGKALNATVWMNFLALRESLMQHNKKWIKQLLEQDDLVSSLVQFVENQL